MKYFDQKENFKFPRGNFSDRNGNSKYDFQSLFDNT
jgi:hypothetical protein